MGTRIDRALVTALELAGHAVTRSRLARAFAAGEVRVEGRAVKPSMKVEGPLTVSVVIPELEPLKAEPEPMELDIVFEDDDLLVVDKPAGMPVHPGPGHPGGTLVNGILHHVGDRNLPVMPGNDDSRPGIVHRIDKDTSGLLVVSKRAAAQEGLAKQFREHTIERRYLAILVGVVPFVGTRRIETLHGRDPADRRRFSPNVSTGRRAVSHFSVEERFGAATLISARLETGRTHQIRMHARHIGHPLLADAMYGPRRQPTIHPAADSLDRQALHATQLGFVHPTSGERLTFQSKLPTDLSDVVEALRSAFRDA